MSNYPTYVLLILVCLFVVVGCAPKKQWHGKYVTVSYTSIRPKEDFRVESYTIVAYDVVSQITRSHVLYRFVLMYNDEKVGALEVTDFSQEMFAGASAEGYEYCLVAGDVESVHDVGYDQPFVSRMIHQLYKSVPSYEVVKNDVIDVISHR